MSVNGAFFQLQTLTLEASATANRQFNAVDGGGISLSQGIYNDSPGAHTFNVPIGVDGATVDFQALGGNLSFTSDFYVNANTAAFAGDNSISISGNMSGAGGSITKNGNGTLTLSGVNSYTGNTTVNAGTLRLSSGLNSALVTVAGGATLAVDESITINNLTLASGASLVIADGKKLTVDGNLTVNSGAAMAILPGRQVTVNGNITNNAGVDGIVIQSTSSGTGSLIHNNTGVQATMQRHIPATANWGTIPNYTGWHMVSSPVAAQSVAAGNWTPTTSGYDLYAWSEATGTWLNQKQPANSITTFTPGRGYLVAHQSTTDKVFSGEVNTTGQTVALTKTGNGPHAGWNLVGNPFASAINLGSFTLPAGVSSPLVWNSSAASYESPNVYQSPAGNIIPAMNGFMVYNSNSGTTNLTIPPSARVHSTTAFYKSDAADDRIVLIAHDLTHHTSQRLLIRFHPDATEGFDPAHDTYYLQGFAPQFYSVAAGQRLITNTLPEKINDMAVRMGFVKNSGEQFRIELAETIPNTTLYLADLLVGVEHPLEAGNPYTFTAKEGDDPMRFELRFSPQGHPTNTAEPSHEKEKASIYASANTLFVAFDKELGEGHHLEVYDTSGRLLLQSPLGRDATQQKGHTLQPGVYIVRITGPQLMQSAPVVVP